MAGIWSGTRGLDGNPKADGPRLFSGLRYHTHIVKPGQVALVVGQAAADAQSFELRATRGSTSYGICSTDCLEAAFTTLEFRIEVTINPDDTWSCDEDTVLEVRGREAPFHHTDRNTLTKIGVPTPKPLARVTPAPDRSLAARLRLCCQRAFCSRVTP
jgi:hypothetical protein